MRKIDGIILVGGKSSRFKKDKAFALYKNQPFYAHSLRKLYHKVDHVYMVVRDDHPIIVQDEKVTLLTDIPSIKGKGPLAGIFSAMSESIADWCFVLPIDTPFVNRTVLNSLLEYTDKDVDAIVPRIKGQIHPLVALYRNHVKELMQHQLLIEERSMHQLLEKIEVQFVEYEEKEEKLFANINTPDQYQRWITDDLE